MKTREVEDRVVTTLQHHGSAASLHHMTRVSHKPIVELHAIMGTEGTLQIEFRSTWSFTSTEPFQMTLFRDDKTTTDITPYNQGNLDDELRSNAQYLMGLSHFCDCILNHIQMVGTVEPLLKWLTQFISPLEAKEKFGFLITEEMNLQNKSIRLQQE